MSPARGALAAILLVGVAVAVGCTSGRPRTTRVLPRDCRAPVLYVALGDSTVEGVGSTSPAQNYVSRLHARLRAVYPGARVDNLGVAGAESRDVLDSQLDRAIALRPDLVTLSIGPNDLTAGVGVEEYRKNVDRILERLEHETGAVVVVNLLPDLAVTPRFAGSPREQTVGRLTAEFNEALRRQARLHGTAVVDLYRASRAEVPRRPELLARDGYHPSDVGYARWAELMWTEIGERAARC